MIVPLQADDVLLADIRRSQSDRSGGFRLWWLGQSGFLLQWQGRNLLFDPYLSDSLTQKYADTDKPHERMTSRPIDPARLDMLDVVTSSHHHTDHLDAETLRPLLNASPNATLIAPAAHRALAIERAGCEPRRLVCLDDGESSSISGFTLHVIPAAHETIERDGAGRCLFLGYVVEFGPWTVYHSGDTVRYDDQAERLARWKIDVALLPINGSQPARRVAGNLWGREAAELAKLAGARLVIPCHYDMFRFNTVTTDEFVATATRLDQPYRILACGQSWSSAELTG